VCTDQPASIVAGCAVRVCVVLNSRRRFALFLTTEAVISQIPNVKSTAVTNAPVVTSRSRDGWGGEG